MKTAILLTTLLACSSSAALAQNPMFIVNGMRYEKCENSTTGSGGSKLPLSELNRDAIENIEIVKGRSAIALYGAAAADGVISVTLKKGAVVPSNLCDSQRGLGEPLFVIDGVVVASMRGEPTPPARPPQDPIAKFLYPPEMVMAHQEAIGLDVKQRVAIPLLALELQKNVIDVQFKLAANGEKLARLLAAPSVDEAAVLQQIDQVLASEREVKRAQLTMLIRIKNQLTPAQQAALDKLK
jgi:heavy-metal resistance protein/TonB-dependent receptor-like protein